MVYGLWIAVHDCTYKTEKMLFNILIIGIIEYIHIYVFIYILTKMYVEVQRVEGASAILEDNVVEEIGKGILAQVWIDLDRDCIQDAQYIGKSLVTIPLFDSVSKKKRPNCISVAERKLEILIIVHKTDIKGEKEIGTNIGKLLSILINK